MDAGYVTDYLETGFAVVRGVFAADEIHELAEAFDRVRAEGMAHRASFRDGNVLFRLSEDRNLGKVLRMVQWPSYFEPVFDRFRRDPRMQKILAPLLGGDLKQIINQVHWKPPGAAHAEFGYHQDIRFRRPREAYRRPENAYVQTGIAVDPHGQANGGMVFYPGSHRLGELSFPQEGAVMDQVARSEDLAAVGLDPDQAVFLELEPGDVALWNVFTVHSSGPNLSSGDRRFYVNGYVRAVDCDRGAWTFRNGRACALGAPVLIHYEDLHRRPWAHYLDD